MTHADFNDLETRDYIFKIGDRGKGIQARYDENTDALIFPRAAFDYVYKLINEALSQEPCTVSVSEKEPNEIAEEVTLRFFKNTLKVRWHDFVIYNVEWLKKNWQMEMDIVCGVKPCDDAISREYLKKIAQSEGAYGYVRAHDIATAPSVTQKSGKWIELPKALNPNENPCKCSECGHVLSFMNCYPKSKYCPNCGADMRGAE